MESGQILAKIWAKLWFRAYSGRNFALPGSINQTQVISKTRTHRSQQSVHTSYLSFLVRRHIFRPLKDTPKKTQIHEKIAPQRNSINKYFEILIYILQIISIFCIFFLHPLLIEILYLVFCLGYLVFCLAYLVFLFAVWINFLKSSPFCVLCGKRYAGLKKVRYRR